MLLLASALLSLCADLIHLKDGRVWSGEIVEELPDRVKIRMEKGAVWVARDQIDRIVSVAALREEYLAKSKAAATAAERRDLALWCRARGLAVEERAEWEAVVRIDPDHEEARGALGFVKHDGRWMTREEAAKAQGLVDVEGEWVTPRRADVLALLAKASSEDLVERGEAKRSLRRLGDDGRAELDAIAEEARARLAAALEKETAVLGALQDRAKTARIAHNGLVANERKFPDKGAPDEVRRAVREGIAELARIGEDPAGAYADLDPALARAARRLSLADAAADREDRWDVMRRTFAAKVGPDAAFRAIDPFQKARAKADEENGQVKMDDAERSLLHEIGLYRMRCGRAPLRWHAKLEACARQHSEEMDRLGYFSHVSPTQKYSTLTKRMEVAGYKSRWIGEILAQGDDPAGVVMTAFQDSPSHHRNLLFADFTRVGIAKKGEYWTVNFGADPE